VFFPKTA